MIRMNNRQTLVYYYRDIIGILPISLDRLPTNVHPILLHHRLQQPLAIIVLSRDIIGPKIIVLVTRLLNLPRCLLKRKLEINPEDKILPSRQNFPTNMEIRIYGRLHQQRISNIRHIQT